MMKVQRELWVGQFPTKIGWLDCFVCDNFCIPPSLLPPLPPQCLRHYFILQVKTARNTSRVVPPKNNAIVLDVHGLADRFETMCVDMSKDCSHLSSVMQSDKNDDNQSLLESKAKISYTYLVSTNVGRFGLVKLSNTDRVTVQECTCACHSPTHLFS